MAVMIGGKQFWLWRAVDNEGEVLDRSCNGDATRLQLSS
jgi:transposase-like protein